MIKLIYCEPGVSRIDHTQSIYNYFKHDCANPDFFIGTFHENTVQFASSTLLLFDADSCVAHIHFVMMGDIKRQHAVIQFICSKRGHGYGKKIMLCFYFLLLRHHKGVKKIVLSSIEGTVRHFYRKLGFKDERVSTAQKDENTPEWCYSNAESIEEATTEMNARPAINTRKLKSLYLCGVITDDTWLMHRTINSRVTRDYKLKKFFDWPHDPDRRFAPRDLSIHKFQMQRFLRKSDLSGIKWDILT